MNHARLFRRFGMALIGVLLIGLTPAMVLGAGTSTTISSSSPGTPPTSTYGESVTFTAAVSNGVPVTTGSVEFFDDAASLGTSALDGSGEASVTLTGLTTLAAGDHTAITAHYLGDGGTNDPSTSSALRQVVTKAHLTVTADPASRAYGVAEPTFTATISGFTNGETLGTSGVTGSASCTTDALLGSAPGPYTITCTQGTLASTNYDFTTFNTGVETIGKATPVITWADPAPITYGTALSGTQLNADSGGVAGTFVYTPVSGTVLSAGNGQTLSVVFHPTDLTDYADNTSKSVTIDVTKAHLTVTADPASRAYGVAEPTFTATISGFTNGETLGTSGVTGSASCTTDALLGSAPGPYTITCTQGTLASTNYDFTTFNTGVETIGKATPVITWADPAPITYGTALSGTQLNADSGGVAGTFVYTPVSGTVLSAGNGQTLSVVFHPTDLTDYADNTSKSVTIDVVAGGAVSFAISAPGTATVGVSFTVTVTAKDGGGNTAASYRGTVHFTRTDGAAVVPGDYTFVAGDNGVHTFTNAFTLNTVGSQTVTATDVGTPSIAGTSAAIAVSPVSCTYKPLTPARILDTRIGTGLSGVFTSRVARTFQVIGHGGVPTGATAVTGNLTVTQQTNPGYLYVGPIPVNNPTSSNLNFPMSDDRANAVTVALGNGTGGGTLGSLSITYVGLFAGSSAHVIFDVTGYFVPGTSGATYHPLNPARILDSRYDSGLSGPFTSHVARTFQVTGAGGVPSGATAVTGNLTVTLQTNPGYLYVGPIAIDYPTSSNLNFPMSDDRANAVIVALGAGGTLGVTYVGLFLGSAAHVIFDVTGYFTPDASGARYVPLNPARILDSRYDNGLSGPFTSHMARTLQVTGAGGVPSGATAVTGNLTVTLQTNPGYLYVGPIAIDYPTSSNLNFPMGDNRANAITVALGTGGTLGVTYVGLFLGSAAHVIFDVTGYFVP
jgi:hypothetical protein